MRFGRLGMILSRNNVRNIRMKVPYATPTVTGALVSMNRMKNAEKSGRVKSGTVAARPSGDRVRLSAPEQPQIAVGKYLWVPGEPPDRDAVTVRSDVLDTVAVLGAEGAHHGGEVVRRLAAGKVRGLFG